MKSSVSIIIPNYNGAKYISACLESCIRQGSLVKEIIVVDDASEDSSWEIIQAYEARYPHLIQGIRNKGKGACSARNNGLYLSTGKYIQWLDSDDILGDNKLLKQVRDLEEHEGKVSICETIYFFDGEDHSQKKSNPESHFFLTTEDRPDFFLARLYGGVSGKGSMVQTSAWVIPRTVVEQAGLWNESLLKDQDGEFFARVLLKSKGVIFNSEVYNYYRKHRNGSNIVNNKSYPYSRSYLDALHLKANYLLNYSDLPESRKGIARLYLEAAVFFYPKYKDLSAEAEANYTKFNYRATVPVIGGRLIEILKIFLGWKPTLRLKSFLQKAL